MNGVKNIAPPILPLPPAGYTLVFQNIMNSVLQQFGARTAVAVNQLLATSTPQNLTYSSVLTFVSGAMITYRVHLKGNVTISPPQDADDGDTVILWLVADATSRTVTLASDIKLPSGLTPTAVAANKKAVCTLRYDAVLNNGQWELTAYQNGY